VTGFPVLFERIKSERKQKCNKNIAKVQRINRRLGVEATGRGKSIPLLKPEGQGKLT